MELDDTFERSKLIIKESIELNEKNRAQNVELEQRLRECLSPAHRPESSSDQYSFDESGHLYRDSPNITLSEELPDTLLQSKIRDLTEKMIEKEKVKKHNELQLQTILETVKTLKTQNNQLHSEIWTLKNQLTEQETDNKQLVELTRKIQVSSTEKAELLKTNELLYEQLHESSLQHQHQVKSLQDSLDSLTLCRNPHSHQHSCQQENQARQFSSRQSASSRLQRLEISLKNSTEKFVSFCKSQNPLFPNKAN